MASALSAGASAAIKYSIAILGRAPTEAELNSFAAAYKGASATASEDAVAAAVVASTAGASALRPGVFSATKQAQVILGNHGVTNDAVVAYVASMIDGTNADAGKVALPLGTVARVVANFFSSWTSTPSNPYNDVFMAGSTALKTASTAAESAILNPVAPTPVTPSYALSAAASVDEGKSTVVTLTTKNVASGDVVNYLISGVDAADVNSLTGSATVGSDGKAYITIAATADATTEGAETMTVTAGGATASIVINDKSTTPAVNKDLTSGVDTTIVGGALDDTFKVSYSASSNNLNAGDQLSGGDGTDTLAITATASTAGVPIGGSVISTGIEVVDVTATAQFDLDVANFTGLTTVRSTGSTGAVNVSNAKAIPALALSGANANLGVTVATAAVAGASDVATLTISGAATTGAANLTINGIETINVVSSGAASGNAAIGAAMVGVASAGTLTTVNVTGDVAARISADVSAATATSTGTITSDSGPHDITAVFDAGDKISMSLGGGNDTARVGSVASTVTMDGGDGTDTLIYTGATGVTAANRANVTGFESIRITNGVGFDYSASTVRYTASPAGSTYAGLTTGGALTLDAGGPITLTASSASATAAVYGGAADKMNVTVGTATTAVGTAVAAATVSAAGLEEVAFTNTAAGGNLDARTVGVTDTGTTGTVSKVTVSGSMPVTLTGGSTALATVDGSGVSGGFTFAGSTTTLNQTASAITGGSGNDNITGSTGADTINVGAGNNTVSGGAGADSITAGDGNDTINGGSGSDNITAGGGNDTIDGSTGDDVIAAGDGTNSITGGTGADTMSGGSGVDTYNFTPNTTAAGPTQALVSTLAAPDVITDFKSGVDKISITGSYAPQAFGNNYVNIQAALSAQGTAGSLAYTAVFVTGENALYVLKNTNGTLDPDDLVIKLNGVTSLSATDLLLGSQGNGNAVLVTGANQTATTASATTGVTEYTANANTPAGSNLLTSANDTVYIASTDWNTAILTGGAGTDTINLSVLTGTTSTTAVTYSSNASVTEFETITLPNHTEQVTLTVADANVVANRSLSISAASNVGNGPSSTGSNPLATAVTINGANVTTATKSLNLTGGSGADALTGGAGNDTITGGSGNDTIIGGTGNDNLSGGTGNDTFTMTTTLTSGDTVAGSTGIADVLTFTNPAAAAATALDNVTGVETITYTPVTAADQRAVNAITISASSSFASDTAVRVFGVGDNFAMALDFTNVTAGSLNITGGTGADSIFGSNTLGDTIDGGATGQDTIRGQGGNDTIILTASASFNADGGAGDDSFTGGTGVTDGDTIVGGSGTDTLVLGSATGTTLASTLGTSSLFSGIEVISLTSRTAGSGATANDYSITVDADNDPDSSVTTDTLTVNGSALSADVDTTATTAAENLLFSAASVTAFRVSVSGGADIDTITGGSLADTISGGAGADIISGGAGADSIHGGEGGDSIVGGTGLDTIVLTETTSTADTIRYTEGGAANVDTVTGFVVGSDLIQISSDTLTLTGLQLASDSGTWSGTGGVDVTVTGVASAGATTSQVFVNVAASSGTVNASAVNGVVKFTSTAASFAAAIGTTSITTTGLSAGEVVLAMYYDSVNSQMVVGAINALGDGTADNITANDLFSEIVRVGMTSTDYANYSVSGLPGG